MPEIKLLDGKKIAFSKNISGLEIAEKISRSLAKEACIMKVNGDLKDISFSIIQDAEVKIITSKDSEGLDAIRHDATHIMAMSVQELFPGTKIAIGPVIKEGFYYGFWRWKVFIKKIFH